MGKNDSVEIHANLPVFSAHKDGGVYVVDVGVCSPDKASIVNMKNKEKAAIKKNKAVKNSDLRTFVEVKKMVVFPMLLAQFVGIVHEIKPKFLHNKITKRFTKVGHFYPTLATTGYLTANSKSIINGFERRNFKINIIENFDNRFFALSAGNSPLKAEKADFEDKVPF